MREAGAWPRLAVLACRNPLLTQHLCDLPPGPCRLPLLPPAVVQPCGGVWLWPRVGLDRLRFDFPLRTHAACCRPPLPCRRAAASCPTRWGLGRLLSCWPASRRTALQGRRPALKRRRRAGGEQLPGAFSGAPRRLDSATFEPLVGMVAADAAKACMGGWLRWCAAWRKRRSGCGIQQACARVEAMALLVCMLGSLCCCAGAAGGSAWSACVVPPRRRATQVGQRPLVFLACLLWPV